MRRSIVGLSEGPAPVLGSLAVKVGDYVFVGGQVAIDPQSGLVSEVRQPGSHVPTIASKFQSEYILDRASAVLKAAGSSLACGLRIDQFCTHPRAASPYLEARGRRIEPASRPASTHVQVDNLLAPGSFCGLQLIALTEEAKSRKDVIVVPEMPASPGPPFKPAPHGIIGGDFIFVTGQIAHGFDDEGGMAREARLNPETWYGSPIKLQADVALNRCASVLKHVGASMSDVVRADVYLNDMDDRFELEEVWKKHFPTDPPARTYIPTVRLGARSCIVEVNMIALKPGNGRGKETITAPNVPAPNLHHPHAIRAGGLLFVSGLCATDFKGGLAPQARVNPETPWFASGAKRQTAFILECIESICRVGGSSLEQVVWTQNFYSRPEDLYPSMEVWNERFGLAPPAALVAGVGSTLLGEDCTIHMDAVAVAE